MLDQDTNIYMYLHVCIHTIIHQKLKIKIHDTNLIIF